MATEPFSPALPAATGSASMWPSISGGQISVPDYIGMGIAAITGQPYAPQGSRPEDQKTADVQGVLHGIQGAVDAGITKATGGISGAIDNAVASLEAKVGPALARIGVALVALVLIGGAIWLLAQTAKAAPAAVAA